MIIALIIFLGTFSISQVFLGAFFASAEAVASVCTLAIFACIALAVFCKMQRAWAGMFIAIIVMVAVDVLAPHEAMLEICLSAIIAVIGTVAVKRPIMQWLRRDARRSDPRVPQWLRLILTLA